MGLLFTLVLTSCTSPLENISATSPVLTVERTDPNAALLYADPEAAQMPVVGSFAGFVNGNIEAINGSNCRDVTPENPVYIELMPGQLWGTNADAGRVGYVEVNGDPNKMYLLPNLPGRNPVDLFVLAHELHHVICFVQVKDYSFVGWSQDDLSFQMEMGEQVEIDSQKGLLLTVKINGKEELLKGLEEMSASLFLRQKLIEAVGNLDSPYSEPYPELVRGIYQLASPNMEIDYPTFLGLLDASFEKGRGQSGGFGLTMQFLEEEIGRQKNALGHPVRIPENFRQDFVKFLIDWERGSDGGHLDIQEIKVPSTLNSAPKMNTIMALTKNGLYENDQIALSLARAILDSPTKRERNVAYSKGVSYLYEKSRTAPRHRTNRR